ncbi:efflux RND transporter periplasmic adaptor subunit [Solidesulfovibrio sp.]|uniref:efflux RND transporter periplasmic adaptor subunit n=1 Tax=Solidesulfovibrio sp. TaxID=2910990 RepID=UPI00262978FD|nr:efflux RND transporter periplasmic adaptor subunit [Solidesulfovibrio sp.]
MTSTRFSAGPFAALALCLALCLAGPAAAETLTFLGKSYCPIKYEITWPFISKPDKGKAQGSGITANVYELPKEQSNEQKSATELGSTMDRLLILSAPLKVGDPVSEDQILITYEMPLENLIAEKQTLSRAELNDAEHALAYVENQLSLVRQLQADLENQAAGHAVAPNTVRYNQQEIEALMLQRDALREKRDLAEQRYDNAVIIAKSKYGKDQDIHKLPRVGYIRAPASGYVLWTNSSLIPGMAFSKQASLISIGRLDPIIIRASVHEIAAQKLKVGDKATVVFHGLPGQPFQTAISKIDFVAQPAMLQQPSFYELEMTLPNPDLRIKEGMRCDVTVDLDAPK